MELTCVGMQFRWTKEAREMLARHAPFKVDLEREPDNEVDSDAIKVVISSDFKLTKLKGKHLGYLRSGYKTGTEKIAQILAPRLDAGTVEVVKLWVTEVNVSAGDAIIDARFRDLPAKLKKVTGRAKKKSLDKSKRAS